MPSVHFEESQVLNINYLGSLIFLFRNAFLVKIWLLILDSVIHLPYCLCCWKFKIEGACMSSPRRRPHPLPRGQERHPLSFDKAEIRASLATPHPPPSGHQRRVPLRNSPVCPVSCVSRIVTLAQSPGASRLGCWRTCPAIPFFLPLNTHDRKVLANADAVTCLLRPAFASLSGRCKARCRRAGPCTAPRAAPASPHPSLLPLPPGQPTWLPSSPPCPPPLLGLHRAGASVRAGFRRLALSPRPTPAGIRRAANLPPAALGERQTMLCVRSWAFQCEANAKKCVYAAASLAGARQRF